MKTRVRRVLAEDASSSKALARRAVLALGDLAAGLELSRVDAGPLPTGALVDVVSCLVFQAFVAARRGSSCQPAETWDGLVADLLPLGLDPAARESIAVDDQAVMRACETVRGGAIRYADLEVEELGWAYEALVGVELTPVANSFLVSSGDARRRAGAHYTSRAVTSRVVERTLAPLLRGRDGADEILGLRVCDPAMGSGAFLVEVCRQLSSRLAEAWVRDGACALADAQSLAPRQVAASCIYGVDRDPFAVRAARRSLWLLAAGRDDPFDVFDPHLRCGDSVLVPGPGELPERSPFRWGAELPEVFGARGGFDAIVGNPPWISYAGRAAQPLDDELFAHYLATSPAFHGFRNLQGIFVHRSATLLRPGGRLGLVLPTSMSDLGGYEPSRRAHDELCACDDELPDLGDGGFEGVFQPCMVLLSTRRASPVAIQRAGTWPLERRDLDAGAARILAALDALPRLPPHLFGERGFQSMGSDVEHLHALGAPAGAFTTPVLVGSDVEPARRRAARIHCDATVFGKRFRPADDWRAIQLLIRQTARYPLVALSDGTAFRNSVLAGFGDDEHPPGFLLAYLNASPIRWYHYTRHRDARQGMPQMKISHLRALPEPPRGPSFDELARLGASVGDANAGIDAATQMAIDALVARLLGLDEAAEARVAEWAAKTRG